MTKSEQAVGLIQRMIEQGELAPGSMVSESKLAELTGIGRTPIREAIQRLALARLIRVHPSKGLEIPGLSVDDQLSALEVRRAVEVLAVELACARANESQRATMRNIAAMLDRQFSLRDYTETVRQTHSLIIEAAHNPYIGATMLPLQSLSRRFWLTHIRDEQNEIRRGGGLHRSILIAIAQQDGGAAKAASLALNDYLVEFAFAIISKRTRT